MRTPLAALLHTRIAYADAHRWLQAHLVAMHPGGRRSGWQLRESAAQEVGPLDAACPQEARLASSNRTLATEGAGGSLAAHKVAQGVVVAAWQVYTRATLGRIDKLLQR